jgi:hypothetical protein
MGKNKNNKGQATLNAREFSLKTQNGFGVSIMCAEGSASCDPLGNVRHLVSVPGSSSH